MFCQILEAVEKIVLNSLELELSDVKLVAESGISSI